ncbi:MAG: DNA polymerase III subunit delta [Candidatus Moranbacteria bacterium]|nr:DNA polymerase III subunit delta [Candidatus Moranbacteria bacterium]MBP9801330.1 DNA polymerase III subunit delta [Candidatus Moranbacteria bacterium]
MLYFLHGEDEVRVGDRRRELMDGFRKKYPTGEIQIFDFEDTGTPEAIRFACSACDQGLFATPKLVVWLHPFVLKEGEEALKKFLARFVKEPPVDISLLLIAPGKIKKTHPIATFLLKKSDRIEGIDLLSGMQLERYVVSLLRDFEKNLSINHSALRTLLKAVGSDMLLLKQEVARLATYRGTGMITNEDVTLFLRPSVETSVFQALDAMSRGEKEKALLLFAQEQAGTSKQDAVYGLLSMCAWQLRRLIQIREVFDRGIRDSAGIARETKLPSFAIQNTLRSLGNLPLSRLTAGLILLADMDAALKIGTLDPGVALDTFVWKF